MCAYASHGDTKHILLFPANPHECFEFAVQAFDLAERFQTPVFMLSRPRHRHERLGRAAPHVGRRLRARPRPGAQRRRPGADAEVLPLHATRTSEFVAPRTLPGVGREGRVLHRAARDTTSTARYTEIPDEYQEVDRPPEAEARGGRAARARAGHRAPRRARRSASSPSAAATSRCAKRSSELAERGVRGRLPARAGLPLRRRGASASSKSTSAASSSSRTATPSSARCSPSRPASPENECTPVLAYGGFPLSAQQVVDERHSAQMENAADAVDHEAPHPAHPLAPANELGLTVRDYEGAMSTLCAGCGHDSVTAAIVHAFFELVDAAAHASPS